MLDVLKIWHISPFSMFALAQNKWMYWIQAFVSYIFLPSVYKCTVDLCSTSSQHLPCCKPVLISNNTFQSCHLDQSPWLPYFHVPFRDFYPHCFHHISLFHFFSLYQNLNLFHNSSPTTAGAHGTALWNFRVEIFPDFSGSPCSNYFLLFFFLVTILV